MAYTKTVWVDGQAPAINASNLNKIENGIASSDATLSTTEYSTRSVTVAAADLAAYVAALPRLLAENLEITVSGGNVNAALRIFDFYNGRIMIKAASGATVTCTKGIWVSRCDAVVVLYGLNVSGSAAYNNEFVRIDWSPRVFLYQLSVNGNGAGVGVRSDFVCMTHMSECSFVNLAIGVQSSDTAQVSLEKCTGSGNTIGIHTSFGGVVLLDGSTPELLGGGSNSIAGPLFKNSSILGAGKSVFASVEIFPGTSAGHGGYIDFHYNNSSADYTSRIIENPQSVLVIQASEGVIVSDTHTSTPRVRNESFASSDTTPSANGQICWTYG